MNIRALLRIIIPALIITLLVVPAAHAQTEQANCSYVLDSNNTLAWTFSAGFEDCVRGFAAEMGARSQNEGVGLWGQYGVYLDASGSVYYADTGNAQSVQWGNLAWQHWGSYTPAQNTANTTSAPLSFDELHRLVVADLNAFWSAEFAAAGETYYEPSVILTSERQWRTGCGSGSAAMGPFYCSADHTIYLPVGFMESALDEIGDFAVASIIAHEWGHALQSQLGLMRSPDTNLELQADCLTGAYGQYLLDGRSEYLRLDEGDLEEGELLMFAVGNRRADELDVWMDMHAHGRPEQRVNSYNVGLEQGYLPC